MYFGKHRIEIVGIDTTGIARAVEENREGLALALGPASDRLNELAAVLVRERSDVRVVLDAGVSFYPPIELPKIEVVKIKNVGKLPKVETHPDVGLVLRLMKWGSW